MLKVLNQTKEKLEFIEKGKVSEKNSTNNATSSSRKKRTSVIIYECHNLVDALDMVTYLIEQGTDVSNKSYDVTRIERICQAIIDCEVTKKECEEESLLTDLSASIGNIYLLKKIQICAM